MLSVISKPLKASIRFDSRSEPLIELVIETSIRGSCRLMKSWEQEIQTRSACVLRTSSSERGRYDPTGRLGF
nr:MAG TPA: hypothetical protein [Caudoviricetes sp.]